MTISGKKLAQMTKKWEKIADIVRKMLTSISAQEATECCMYVASKGNCVLYSTDGRHFNVPLAYLGTTIFVELVRIYKEEFGFRSDGGITLTCDAAGMDCGMCLLIRNASYEVERTFLSYVVRPCQYENGLESPMGHLQYIVVPSF